MANRNSLQSACLSSECEALKWRESLLPIRLIRHKLSHLFCGMFWFICASLIVTKLFFCCFCTKTKLTLKRYWIFDSDPYHISHMFKNARDQQEISFSKSNSFEYPVESSAPLREVYNYCNHKQFLFSWKNAKKITNNQ